MAKQPILNVDKEAVAYELLFRNGLQNAFQFPDGTTATSQVMVNSLMLFGIRSLTCGNKAFINVTEEVLVKDYIQLFPPDLVVPEILEDIEATPEVIAACLRLKRGGYQIALDDIIATDDRNALLAFADILKVDFMQTDTETQEAIAKSHRKSKTTLLAEKVETYDEFKRAKEMGYTLFQGYFFAKPEVLSKKNVPGDRLRYLQLIRQIHQSELDLDQIEKLIKQDVSLSYRILRYINSAYFGWNVEIRSIKQALVLLGELEIKRWATLVAMAYMGADKPTELILTALTRGRFCEFVAPQINQQQQSQNLFLMGMFSVLDAVMDQPLQDILAEMPISHDVKDALLGKEGQFKNCLDMAICYEKGDWPGFSRIADTLGAEEQMIPDAYLNAVDWATKSIESSISRTPSKPY